MYLYRSMYDNKQDSHPNIISTPSQLDWPSWLIVQCTQLDWMSRHVHIWWQMADSSKSSPCTVIYWGWVRSPSFPRLQLQYALGSKNKRDGKVGNREDRWLKLTSMYMAHVTAYLISFLHWGHSSYWSFLSTAAKRTTSHVSSHTSSSNIRSHHP